MKKRIKRVLCLVMALVLLGSLLPMQTSALELSQHIHTVQTEVSVNPLYEGLVDEALLLSKHPQMPDAEINADAGSDYVDEAGAVELLRAAMVSRQGTVVIPLATADTNYSTQMKRIFQTALKHTGNPVEGDYLMWQYATWKANAQYYEDSGIRYYTATFTLTYYTTAEQEATVDTAVEELLESLDLESGTDYEKVKGVYDYICANVTYDHENLNDNTYTLKHSAYAALIDGTAVCQGYALLLYRLALELGVDCRLVAGLGGTEPHGWNIIRMEDMYYNADSTWDAGDTVYTYFLVSEDNFPNHIRGNYSESNGMDYSGETFYAEYPMGTENYVPVIPEVIASGTCGEDLTWKLDDTGKLTISGTGAMTDFTSSGQPWRDWKQDICSVVIGEGVTSIGDYAFFHCYSLANVKLPDTVTRIGNSAFFYCSALPEVELPANLQTIDNHAFGSCRVLTGMEFPAGLKTIGVTAFSGTEVGSAVLPEGITAIGSQAFLGCPLTEAVIPASLESIGYCAFQDCAPLDFITVDENNPIYCNDSQGAMYTKDMGTLIVVPGGFAGEFAIPDSVAAITGCAMRNCDLLTDVTIPETVSEIGELAFYDSAALESVVWPAAAAKVPRSVFSWCTGLSSITLPEGVTVLDQSAFYGCDSLREITVPASVTELGSLCFGKSGLQTVTFLGDPPTFTNANAFTDVTAEACYPADNANWTEEVRQQYGGTITWTAVTKTCAHEYKAAITAPTCTEEGCTTYTCILCGHSYEDDYTDALGHDYVDGSCSRCAEASPFYTAPAVTSNLNDHWYINVQRWNDPINSYLRAEGDGYLRVEYTGSDLAIEEYDADFRFVTGRKLALELPLFGGVYLCDDYNFVLVGQTNPNEDDTAEVIRVVRYSKDWQRLDSASLYGANTVEPFDAGCARFDRCGDMLYIRTCHTMYADDNGLNHQANLTMAVRISDMTVTDEYSRVMNPNYGYVSHSFNQFVRVDGTTLVTVDHGDAYTRSVVLMKYPYSAAGETFAGRVSYVETLPIAGTIGANDTGVSVGGFEFSSTHYLIAGNSAEQLDTTSLRYAHRNIFVTATPKDNFTGEATAVNWITSYTEADGVNLSPPHLVKTGSDRFLLIWTADEILTYCFLDGQGNQDGEIYTADGALSDCSPIVVGDRVLWYVTNNSEPKFYILDLNNPGSVTWPHTHEYSSVVTEATCTEGGFTTYTCSVCGHSYRDDYTDALQHSWSEATCTTPKTCSRCGLTEGEAPGHDYEVVITEPTCTDKGYTTHTCCVCGYSYIDSEVESTGHDWKAATCTEPKVCKTCGETEGEAAGHSYVNGFCSRCDGFESCTDSDGDGYYEIGNGGQLYWFAANAAKTDNAVLTGDIYVNQGDLTNYDGSSENTWRAWNAIGGYYDPYKGVFDGQGYTVSGLYHKANPYREEEYFGIFGRITGTVRNLGIVNTYFDHWTYFGGIVGYNSGTIERCYFDGTLMGYEYVGGIAGYNYGMIRNCYNSGRVDGSLSVGGIAGASYKTLENCHNVGTVNAALYYCGSIVGRGSAANCYYLENSASDKTTIQNGIGAEEKGKVTADVEGATTVKTAAAFESGEVTWLLNGETPDGVWKQTLGQHAYPVFSGQTVYYGYSDCSDNTAEYSNEVRYMQTPHNWKDGVCEDCGARCRHAGGEATCTEKAVCEICFAKYGDPLGHDFGDWETAKEATCTEDGQKCRDCFRCDHYETEVLPKLGHGYKAVVTAPTCTEDGYTTHTCSRCADTYTDAPAEALGHNFGNWETAVEATCTENGQQRRDCDRCDHYDTQAVDALGHDYVDGVCSRCGVEEPAVEGVIRLSGKNRYDTAFAVANQLKELMGVQQFSAVVVAYGQNFPDALTGSYLAAVKNAPILLTEPSADASVLEYIEANLVPGGKVYILGGGAAVSENFENVAKVMGFDVERLKGKNRYITNLEILKEAGVNPNHEVLIATGTNYADSLSASATGLPMLLVGDSLTDAQKEFLSTTSKNFVILGGTGAVSAEVEAELAAIGTVVRVKGANRYGTSVAIAERYFANPKAAVLAYAQGFPDGLCGGPLAVSMDAPLILTSNESPSAADDYIKGITAGAVTGGTGRISDDTVREIFDLAADTEIPKP